MFRTQIEIFTPRSFGRIPRHPEDGYMAEDVTESIIHQISEEKLIPAAARRPGMPREPLRP